MKLYLAVFLFATAAYSVEAKDATLHLLSGAVDTVSCNTATNPIRLASHAN